ncbi:MAG: hypothetical protein ACLRQ4_00435 [Neglectibacter timonensis]
MERLSLDAFTKYTFLSGLACAPEDGTPAFLCAKADTGENGYLRDLWVLKDRDAPLRLTGDGKTGAFLWDSADTLLFTSSRSEEGKKKREAGEERTDFYRISLHGGEAEEAFSVPLSVTPLAVRGRLSAAGGLGHALLQGLYVKRKGKRSPVGGEKRGLPCSG